MNTESYEWSESGRELLAYFNYKIQEYGLDQLSQIIENELTGKYLCHKIGCAYCANILREYVYIPRIPSSFEYWSDSEIRKIYQLAHLKPEQIVEFMPNRTLNSVRVMRSRLMRFN